MFYLPNLLVVGSTYSTHFSDSVCGRPSVRQTLRYCIGIGLNQSITVLKSIGFSKKMSKTLQLIKKCSVLKNFISSYKIKVMPRGQCWISKCQKSKITCFGHNFVMNKWIFKRFWQTINPDDRLCRALKTEFYFQGQGHTKRSTTKQRPSKAFFKIVWKKNI